MKKLISILLIAAIVPTFIFADNFDSLFETSESEGDSSLFLDDSLFADDNLFDDGNLFENEGSSSASNINLVDDLLTSGAEISGSYSFSFKTGLLYDFETQSEPDYFSTSTISTEIELSARPTTDTRFYTKVSLDFPFENIEDDVTTAVNEESTFFNIDELFYDFIVDDYYVRVGKQTLNMGVGYFYSPANLLNVTTINPLSPEDDQEGPLAIKVNKPIGNDNIYAYVTFPNSSDYDPTDVGYAARIEKVIGNGEYSLSGFYTYDSANSPTKLALTASTSLFPDIDIVAEAVESYDGSDFAFSGTAGIQVLKDLEDLTDTSVSFIAQYYYNQDGLVVNGPISYDATHQLGAVLSLSLPNDLGLSLTTVNVLSESSGVLMGNVWYDMNDNLSIDLGATYSYGATNTIQPYIGITLGEGDF
jgi:hypothetical protein